MTITVRNGTPFEVTIHASGCPERSVTPLGVVPRQITEIFHEVSDEGPTWYFHLDSSGVDGGTMVRRRLISLAQFRRSSSMATPKPASGRPA